MKQITLLIVILAFCIFIFFSTEVYSENIALKLPVQNYAQVEKKYKEVLNSSFLICGNDHIGQTRKYLSDFFQGTPQRGFLISPPLLDIDIKRIIRNEPRYPRVTQILTGKFSEMVLVSLDKEFQDIVIMKNPEVEIIVPESLHECLIDQSKMWGCGVTEVKNEECCEKKLGSLSIKATWIDQVHDEMYTLIYAINRGCSMLIRKQNMGNVIYYCITSDKFFIAR